MTTDTGGARTTTDAGLRPSGDLLRALMLCVDRQPYGADLLRAALRIVAAEFGAPYASLKAPIRGGTLDDYCHAGPTDPNFWRSSVEETLTQAVASREQRIRRFRSRDGELRVAIVATPLLDPRAESIGAFAVVVEVGAADVDGVCEKLRAASAILGMAMRGGTAGSEQQATLSADQAEALRTTIVAGSQVNRIALGIAMTNQLRAKLGCESVAIGDVVGRRVKLLSVSGFAEVTAAAHGSEAIRAAMEECLDLDRPVVASAGRADGDSHPLHRKWSSDVEGACVASIPLRVRGATMGVLSLRHAPGRVFTEEDVKKIAETTAPYAAALDVARRASRSLIGHAAASCMDGLRSMRHLGGALKATAVLAVVALAAWIVFGTMMHRVSAVARVQPSLVRHLSAPMDSVLARSEVSSGDRVRAGDVLFTLDVAPLELERARLAAAIASLAVQAEAARAKGDFAEVRSLDAKAEVERTSLRIVERQIAEAVVRAPVDGLVLRGDLRERQGAAVAAGETLVEFVPASAIEIEVDLHERDVLRVVEGAVGAFRPTARPDETMAIRVVRVHPSAEARNGANVFRVDAVLDGDAAPPDWIRCGVEGTVRIDAGEKPVWWSLFHRLIDAARMRLWM
jgi:multidrug resistance efflux pump